MRVTFTTLLGMCVSLAVIGCGRGDKQLAHEMRAFAIAYHNRAQGEGHLAVDDAGAAKIDWKGHSGPSKLEDMASAESGFPELAKRIRAGTFVVVWRAKLRPTAEENSKYYLGHDAGIEEKGGWVLRADGRPEHVSPEEFKKLQPIPTE